MVNGGANTTILDSTSTETTMMAMGDGEAVMETEGTEGGAATLPERVGCRVESEAQRREANHALDSKPRCSHMVHCPFFPLVSLWPFFLPTTKRTSIPLSSWETYLIVVSLMLLSSLKRPFYLHCRAGEVRRLVGVSSGSEDAPTSDQARLPQFS